MYKTITLDGKIVSLEKQDGNILISIPFDPANTDYIKFKLDLADGVELQDADGNTMTAEEVAEFVATLP